MDYLYNLKALKKAFSNGENFTLFVGAGLNASKSVHLLWNELISEACCHAFRRIGYSLNLKGSDTNHLLSFLGINPIDWDKNPIFRDVNHISHQDVLDYIDLKEYITTHFPIEIQVSIIKTLLGDAYIPFLQDYLYSQCNKKIIRKYFEAYKLVNINNPNQNKELYTLYVVARMVLLNPEIQNIVSYNYDNFLSYAICYLLKRHDEFFTREEVDFLKTRYRLGGNQLLDSILPAKDIGRKEEIEIKSDWRTIPIYHVHGYIPSKDELQYEDSPNIVLSMDEYCSTLREKSTWRIVTQENFILTSNSLFIGSSLTDLTTKRILNLHEHNRTHKVFMLDAYKSTDNDTFNKERARQIFREIRDSYLTSLDVHVIDCENGFEYLFDEIFKITTFN